MRKVYCIAVILLWMTAYGQAQNLPGRYHRYIEVRSILTSLRDSHPEIMQLDTVGYSQRWHIPMLDVRLSNNPNIDQDKPVALICGGAHANEVLGPEVVLGFIQDIIQRYASGDQQAINLINSLEIHLVPMINPDGHVVVENDNTDWRKNQCDNDGNGIFNFHDGVDNNRNYDMGWGIANDANAVTPESAQYKGTAPFTQAENIALRNFGWHYHPTVALDYHSPAFGLSEVVYYPWYWRTSDGGNGAAPDEPLMQSLAYQFASLITNDDGDSTYRARRGIVSEGDFNTYFYGNFGTTVFTVEVSDTTIQNPSMVDGIVARNIPSIYYLLQRALQGRITGIVRDSVTLEPIEAEVRVMERNNADINPRMTRADFGRYDRILGPGNYTLGFLKSGYYPRQISNVSVSGSPVMHDVMLMPMSPRPPAPTLIYPADNQTIYENWFAFDWSDVGLATHYLIEIAGDSLFSNIVLRDSNVTVSSFAAPSPLANGNYYWRVKGANDNGWGPYSGSFRLIIDSQSSIDGTKIPADFTLLDCYPNPFNSSTTIEYELGRESRIDLNIYSIGGQLIAPLIRDRMESEGTHRIIWDGRNSQEQALSSGVYFCELKVGNERSVNRLVLLR